MLIVLDGMNGVGKTTILLELEVLFKDRSDIVFTEDPGGTSLGMELKRMMNDRSLLAPITRLHMFCAARRELCDRVIQPALEEGKHVICDRYIASTYAYQHNGAGIPFGTVRHCVDSGNPIIPDLTVILDCHPEIAIRRVRKRGRIGEEGLPKAAHIQVLHNQDLNFYKRVRKGFIKYAKREKVHGVQDTMIVNTGQDLTYVVERLKAHLDSLLAAEA